MTAPTLSLLPQRAKCENNAQGRALGPPEIGAVPLAKSAHGQMGAGFCFSGAVLPGEQVDLQFSSAHSQHEAEIPAKKCRILKCPPPSHPGNAGDPRATAPADFAVEYLWAFMGGIYQTLGVPFHGICEPRK